MPRFAALMLVLFVLPVSAQEILDPEHLPWGAVAREGTVRLRHSGPIMRAVLSRDGKYVMSAGAGGFVILSDIVTGKRVKLMYHASAVTGACFTPNVDGIELSCAHGNFAQLSLTSKADPGLEGYQQAPPGLLTDRVIFGGIVAVVVDETSLHTWDVLTKKRGPKLFEADGILCIALAPNTVQIAAGLADGSIRVLNIKDGKIVATFRGHEGEVLCMAFSVDKKRLVSGGQDGTLRVWDIATGKELRKFTAHKAPIASVAFHPDGERVLSGDGAGRAILWDAGSGKVRHTILAHRGRVGTVAFHVKGTRAVTGGADHIVRVWNVETGKQVPIGPDPEFNALYGLHKKPAFVGSTLCMAIHKKTGRILCGYDNGTYIVWDRTGKKLATLNQRVPGRVAAFFPDGERVVISGPPRQTIVRNWKTGATFMALSSNVGTQRCATATPDGKSVLSGGSDNVLRLWNAAQELLQFKGHTKAVVSVAIHPDGDLAASGGWDGRVCLWDMHTGRLMRWYAGHRGAVTEVEWLDGNRIRSASQDTTALTWRTSTMVLDKAVLARLKARPASIPQILEVLFAQSTGAELYKLTQSRRDMVALGDETVAFLETRIFPVVGAPHIEGACKALGADAHKDRMRAREMLRRIGPPALTRLKQLAADTDGDPEVFLSARDLVKEISAQPVRPPLNMARAESCVPVLEWIGTKRARALLEVLTHGVPAAGLTLSAKAALKRLAKRDQP